MNVFESAQMVNDPVRNAPLPIRIEPAVMEKIVHFHVRKPVERPLWDHWAQELVESLRRLYDTFGLQYDCVELEHLAELILNAARQSLSKPLVLFGLAGPSMTEWRVAMLPIGAIVVLRGGRNCRIATCFFPTAWNTVRPDKQYEQAAMQLVWKYGEPNDESRTTIPTTDYAVYVGGEEQEWRRKFRFITAANWGFSGDVSGSLHSGRIPKWEATPVSYPTVARSSRKL